MNQPAVTKLARNKKTKNHKNSAIIMIKKGMPEIIIIEKTCL